VGVQKIKDKRKKLKEKVAIVYFYLVFLVPAVHYVALLFHLY